MANWPPRWKFRWKLCRTMENPKVTPEQVTELIIDSVAGMDGVNQEALDKLSQALTAFMQTTLDQAATQEKDDEKPEQ